MKITLLSLFTFLSFVFSPSVFAQSSLILGTDPSLDEFDESTLEISVPIIDEDSVPTAQDSPLTIDSNCTQTDWCTDLQVDFNWKISEPFQGRIKEYQWSLDTQIPNTKPLKTIGQKTELHFETLSDGVFYLYVQAIIDDNSKPPLQIYRIKMDREPPQTFDLTIKETVIELGQKTQVSFFAKDENSGIDKYEVSVDNGGWIEKDSPLIIEGGEQGVYNVRVRAIDRAGNERIAEGTIEVVEKLPTPVSSGSNFTQPMPESSLLDKILVPFLIVTIGLLTFGFFMLLKKKIFKHFFEDKKPSVNTP